METTSKISLGAQEVCAILEASAKANVSKLKFGGLEVEFGGAPIPAPTQRGWYGENLKGNPALDALRAPFEQDTAPAPVTAITDEMKKAIAEALRRDEVSLKEDQLANAIVEDPVLAEELLEAELRQTELTNDVPSERRE